MLGRDGDATMNFRSAKDTPQPAMKKIAAL